MSLSSASCPRAACTHHRSASRLTYHPVVYGNSGICCNLLQPKACATTHFANLATTLHDDCDDAIQIVARNQYYSKLPPKHQNKPSIIRITTKYSCRLAVHKIIKLEKVGCILRSLKHVRMTSTNGKLQLKQESGGATYHITKIITIFLGQQAIFLTGFPETCDVMVINGPLQPPCMVRANPVVITRKFRACSWTLKFRTCRKHPSLGGGSFVTFARCVLISCNVSTLALFVIISGI